MIINETGIGDPITWTSADLQTEAKRLLSELNGFGGITYQLGRSFGLYTYSPTPVNYMDILRSLPNGMYDKYVASKETAIANAAAAIKSVTEIIQAAAPLSVFGTVLQKSTLTSPLFAQQQNTLKEGQGVLDGVQEFVDGYNKGVKPFLLAVQAAVADFLKTNFEPQYTGTGWVLQVKAGSPLAQPPAKQPDAPTSSGSAIQQGTEAPETKPAAYVPPPAKGTPWIIAAAAAGLYLFLNR